ncbi:MAG: hydantoinase B/oxoprolinase family protein [Planctomycetes bacterium]|nr:hydantoinase B/oxoprolinase family protein [Planctomycetota bacterium]
MPKHDIAAVSVLHHALVGAAEEMGEVLKRSAFSPNIKERQDYSCALFDARGRLIAQAAHLPVHLGSMPASVHAVIDRVEFKRDGDFAIVNDPYNGGTHLPDITMVAPVYEGKALIGYAANRAHHADIGGAAPGSMSPQTELMAEGLIIPPMLLTRETLALVAANTRTPDERRGDLKAQQAACARGGQRLREAKQHWGGGFDGLCDALVAHSRNLMRHSLKQLKPGVYRAADFMDDDGAGTTNIRVAVTLTVKRGGKLTFDFTGSAPQVKGGVNAVAAVTASACYYACLCLCDPVPPVNAGCFEDIRVIAPEGTIVNARRPAAVAGGNVETSQRIVDVCFAALAKAGARVAAQSQGTMNNVTIGGVNAKSATFTYYETIAGGCGGTDAQPGASATHSHMTNTLNTPIEALEHAYPLRVEEYSIREGAKGGRGVVRRIRALVPCEFGLLTERRKRAPKGGEPGVNRVCRAKGQVETLPAKCSGKLDSGDSLEIITPNADGAED